MTASDKRSEETKVETKTAESKREADVKPKAENEEVASVDAPIQENKPTDIDPESDQPNPEDKLEETDNKDDYVIDPIGGGKMERNSRFSPYRDL